MSHSRLSALECVGRGISNLRANWELVPTVFVQIVTCSVLAVVGGYGFLFVLGAAEIFSPDDFADPERLRARIEALSWSWPALAIGLSLMFIMLTIVTLIYCWFQAGIVTTLERGDRQAPPGARTDWSLFRTFSRRNLFGWSNAAAWRFFWLLGWMLALAMLFFLSLAALTTAGVFLIRLASTAAATAFGCFAVVGLVGFLLVLNVWFAIGQTLAAREDYSVLAAAGKAFGILRGRVAAAFLLTFLFIVASLTSAVVFVPLTQGMTIALGSTGLAATLVQTLLMIAQWLVSAMLSIAFFGAVVALVRSELAPMPGNAAS